MKPAGTSEFLASHPLFRTGDLDEARQCVTQKFCDHRLFLSASKERLTVRHNHVAGANLSVNYLGYGARVQIDPGMLERFYLLQIPLSGKALVKHRGQEVCASKSTATLLNPDRETDMTWTADCRKLLLQIDKSFLHATAESMLEMHIPGPVRFVPAVDLTQDGGRQIRTMVLQAARLAECGALFGDGNAVQDQFIEKSLVSSLLRLQGSNVSHFLSRRVPHVLPAGIKRALVFIHTNFAEPIRLKDITVHSGMNSRSIQKGFQRCFDLTPMQVVQRVRLNAAHYYLSTLRPTSVTEAAFICGFSHLGRFSRDYKMRFGRLPSDTLLEQQ